MGSRERILQAVRSHRVPPATAPSLDRAWIEYADCRRQFAETLASVGGRCEFVDDHAHINRLLADMPSYSSAKKIVSLVDGVGSPNVELNVVDDPHELEDVDFAIARADFAVAENGAVWLTDAGIKHRAILFIVQHLALVVPASRLLNNMHEAYQRLQFPAAGFGLFLSGPSKTADIEQSLVIGAHGPRSLTVFCLEG